MRVRSGAPWYECTGIPPERGQILRPLLNVSRNKLREWVRIARVPCREDETNCDQRFVRNRLRAQLAAHPDFWTLERVSETARAGEELRLGLRDLRRLAQVLPRWVIPAGFPRRIGLAIDEIFRYFNKLNFIPVEAVWADLAGLPTARLASSHRRQVTAFLHGHSPSARLPLPYGISALRAGTAVWLYKEPETFPPLPVGTGRWPLTGDRGTLTISRGEYPGFARAGSVALKCRFLDRELWVRPWRPAERLRMRGRPVKKIADLLAEQGVDPAARPHVLVLADAAGPLMIFGGAVAERALPTPDETEVTRIDWIAPDANGALHALLRLLEPLPFAFVR